MALNDRELLAKTLQAEAGNQGIGGMLAVGSVIRNRMAQGGSLSDVILAPAQFSAWNKVTGAVGGEQGQDMAALKPSEDAYAAADAILSGNAPDVTGGATHYYNPSISNPAWGKEKAGGDWTKIGAHIFGKAGDFRTGAAKMNGEQAQKPQGLLGGLLGGQGIGGALGMSDDFRDKLAMAVMAGSGDARLQPLIAQRAASMEERKAEAKLEKPKKATIDYLRKQGFGEIADLVDAGSITASAGATLAYQEGQAIKGLERSMALEAFKAGIKPEKPLTELAKIQADYAAGRLSPEQYETAVQVYANKNKMGLRVGADGAIQFTQGGDFKFTEQQSKDNVYATRAAGALEAFEPVASALTSFPMRAAEFDPTGVARGAVQSDEFQLAQQSGNEFLQAVLRKDTGAAITPNEMVLYGKTYLPQPGDNEKVLAQKSLARKRAVAAIQSGMSPLQILTSEKALAAGRPADQASTAPTGDLSMLSDEELDALIGDLSGGQKK